MTEHAKMYIETLEAITYCEDCHGQYRTIDYGKTDVYKRQILYNTQKIEILN